MENGSAMKRASSYELLQQKAKSGGDIESSVRPSTAPEKPPSNISWSDLQFTAKTAKGDLKILDNVWGTVQSGEVCCIMGSSGAGKSSLLNVLAGRSSTGGNVKVAGNIQVNGKPIDPVTFCRNVAYVMQDDALMATATPREAFEFSAMMRLPQDTPRDVIKKLVDKTVEDLALQSCADTMIGGPMIKGISGGQRKRTSVGVEIITKPSLLFLDEPTSGLDSFSAYNCIQLLKRLAAENTTVLCTIHQPASEVFFLFDRCIFMKSGRIFFQGPTAEIVDHFDKRGFPCPKNYNPSDFIMQLSQIESTESCEAKGLFMDQPADFQHSGATWVVSQAVVVDSSADAAADSTSGVSVTQVASPESAEAVFIPQVGAGFMKQLMWLSWRETQSITRDVAALVGRFGVTIFLNLLFGLIFYNAGGGDDSDRTNFNSHFGAVTMILIASMFGAAQPVMLLFPFERPMFMREYSTGTYSASAYFVSKTLMELPLTLAQSCCQWLLVYFLCNFQGNGGYLILISWALGAASASVACALGCAVPDVKSVQEMAPLLFVPQLLFAGFFIQTSQIPVFLRWAQYLCGIKYAMNLTLLTEFNKANPSCSGGAAQACKTVISSNDIEEDKWWAYILILCGLFVFFRVVAMIILTQKAKKFY